MNLTDRIVDLVDRWLDSRERTSPLVHELQCRLANADDVATRMSVVLHELQDALDVALERSGVDELTAERDDLQRKLAALQQSYGFLERNLAEATEALLDYRAEPVDERNGVAAPTLPWAMFSGGWSVRPVADFTTTNSCRNRESHPEVAKLVDERNAQENGT